MKINPIKPIQILSLVLLLSAMLAGCSEKASPQAPQPEPQNTQVTPNAMLFPFEGAVLAGGLASTSAPPAIVTAVRPYLQNLSSASMLDSAYDAFQTYALSRLDVYTQSQSATLSSGASLSSSQLSNVDFVRLLSSQSLDATVLPEFSARNGGVNTAGFSSLSAFASRMGQQLNRTPNMQVLTRLQGHFRQLIPELALSPSSPQILPLESYVLAWAYITGDDGNAAPGSLRTRRLIQSSQSSSSATLQGCDPVTVFVALTISVFSDYLFNDGQATQSLVDVVEWFRDPFGVNKGYTPRDQSQPAVHYLTMVDLLKGAKELSHNVNFDNSNPPAEALALLPGRPNAVDYSTIAQFDSMAQRLTTQDEVDRFEAGLESFQSDTRAGRAFDMAWWRDHRQYLRKGDIVFFRQWSPVSQGISYLSSWTHAGVLYDTSLENARSLESYPNGGVQLRRVPQQWSESVSFTAKRIHPSVLSRQDIEDAVDDGYNTYLDLPYFPSIRLPGGQRSGNAYQTSMLSLFSAFYDKDQTGAMYCSKLVWNIYDDAGVDLDSNRFHLQGSFQSREGLLSNGLVSAIGNELINRLQNPIVTPDELYYSPYLMSDIVDVAFGLEHLGTPLLQGQTSLSGFSTQHRPMPRVLDTQVIAGTLLFPQSLSVETYGHVMVRSGGSLTLQTRQGVDLTPGFEVQEGASFDIAYF